MRRKLLFLLVVLASGLAGCDSPATPLAAEPTDEPIAIPTETIAPTDTPTPASTQTPIPEVPPDPETIAQDYPRVDGSTSTLPLQTTVACDLLGVTCAWAGGEDDEEVPLLPWDGRRIMPVLFAEAPTEAVETVFSLWHTGTHSSYVNLIEGNADFILVARSPSQDERIAANGYGVELDVRPVALDAFVFLVNTTNPVDDLTTEAIRDIYTGQVTDWAALGGPEESIQAYLRNENSGSQELMKTLVMQGEPMIDAPDMILESMMGPINVIGEDPLGIGYSVYFYATYILPSQQIKLIGINGVHPTPESIANHTYPLTTEVYAVVRADTPPDSSAVMLRDWLFTAEGQAAIAESGYVPLEQ